MRPHRNGFTLIEMVVALLVLGLIAAAGVSLLSFAMTNREAVRESFRDSADLQRARQLLKADLGQVVGLAGQSATNEAEGTARGEGAALAQPLPVSGGAAPGFLTVTRYVGAGPDGAPNAPLQRIEYLYQNGQLERVAYASWRGDQPLNRQVLLSGVRSLEVRFISYGVASTRWPSANQRVAPDAVVVTLDSPRFGRLEQWFLVGSGPA